jgi:hypothetical protein
MSGPLEKSVFVSSVLKRKFDEEGMYKVVQI